MTIQTSSPLEAKAGTKRVCFMGHPFAGLISRPGLLIGCESVPTITEKCYSGPQGDVKNVGGSLYDSARHFKSSR